MAPKSMIPGLTDPEKEELARLLEKSKMAADWSTWQPEASTAAASTVATSAMAAEVPKAEVSKAGAGYQRNRKSLAMMAPPTGAAAASDGAIGPIFTPGGLSYDGSQEITYGAMTDGSKRRCSWSDPPSYDPTGGEFEFVSPEEVLEEKELLDAIAEFQHLPVGHHGSPHQYPIGQRSCLNMAVPLPHNYF